MSTSETQATAQTGKVIRLTSDQRRELLAKKKAEQQAELREFRASLGESNGIVMVVNRNGGVFVGGNVVLNAYITQILWLAKQENMKSVIEFALANEDAISFRRRKGTDAEEDAAREQFYALAQELGCNSGGSEAGS